jgi:hypothetical protein
LLERLTSKIQLKIEARRIRRMILPCIKSAALMEYPSCSCVL